MFPMENSSFSFMFSVFPFIFMIVFVLIIGLIVYAIVSGASRYHKNNQSPVLTVEATVVSKRTDVSHHHNHTTTGTMDHMSSSWYYVTFQVESGDRMELSVRGEDFGMLAEGDVGRLTFQGTRYLGFQRRF
ncbi:MAG: Conserved domain protein histidine-rich [Herbinix sp.]|jgi:hypothetical protein|nr:Conserved domain protein histidine-rich [Herbinix sp.]